MKIGNTLKQLRIESGVLQKDLANILNLSQQTISLYESDRRQPDYDTLKTISNFFNVSTDYILGITDISEPISIIFENSSKYNVNKNLNSYLPYIENPQVLSFLDMIIQLSPKGKEDLKQYIEFLLSKENQIFNSNASNEIDIEK